MKKQRRKPSTEIRRIVPKGDPSIKMIVFHKLPPDRNPLPIVSNPKARHYCPDPYRRHPGQKILMFRAGGAPSGNRFIQRWRCGRCLHVKTYSGG